MMVAVVERWPMPQPRSARQFPYSRGCRPSAGCRRRRAAHGWPPPGRGAPVNWFTAPRPAAASCAGRRDRRTRRARRSREGGTAVDARAAPGPGQRDRSRGGERSGAAAARAAELGARPGEELQQDRHGHDRQAQHQDAGEDRAQVAGRAGAGGQVGEAEVVDERGRGLVGDDREQPADQPVQPGPGGPVERPGRGQGEHGRQDQQPGLAQLHQQPLHDRQHGRDRGQQQHPPQVGGVGQQHRLQQLRELGGCVVEDAGGQRVPGVQRGMQDGQPETGGDRVADQPE